MLVNMDSITDANTLRAGREKFRILLIVIPPTVGDPVKFQWSVANSRTIRSSMRLLLIGYVIRIS